MHRHAQRLPLALHPCELQAGTLELGPYRIWLGPQQEGVAQKQLMSP